MRVYAGDDLPFPCIVMEDDNGKTLLKLRADASSNREADELKAAVVSAIKEARTQDVEQLRGVVSGLDPKTDNEIALLSELHISRRAAEQLRCWLNDNWCIELEHIAKSSPGNDPRNIALPWSTNPFVDPGEPFKADENDGSGSLRA